MVIIEDFAEKYGTENHSGVGQVVQQLPPKCPLQKKKLKMYKERVVSLKERVRLDLPSHHLSHHKFVCKET
jgi:hypothetical protein